MTFNVLNRVYDAVMNCTFGRLFYSPIEPLRDLSSRNADMTVLTNQIQQSKQERVDQDFGSTSETEAPDYDAETVCCQLNAPYSQVRNADHLTIASK